MLTLRFGLDGQARSLEQVGAVLGVTRERARQIEVNALKALRGQRTVKALVSYLREG